MNLRVLQVETTNLCNAKCIFCVHSQLDKLGIMSGELYRKIVDEAVELYPSLYCFIPSMTGEPLLDPDIIEKLQYARKKLATTIAIHLYTNGSFLTPDYIKAFAELKHFSLYVSINGHNKETRKRLTGLDDYDKVVSITREAIVSGIKVIPVFVNTGITKSDEKQFVENWKYQKEICILSELNYAGSGYIDSPSRGVCYRAIIYLSVLWDGRVNLCCMDVPEKLVFGDLTKQKLIDVWNSVRRQEYSEKHFRGEGRKLERCKDCNHPVGRTN